MTSIFKRIKDLMIIAIIVFILFEITLRIFPGLIPPVVLLYFNDDLSDKIARRVNLPTESRSYEILRDDGGPYLKIYQPQTTFKHQTDGKSGAVDMTTDEKGFCNPPSMSYDKAIINIIAIGDSFTWCTLVSANAAWPALLHNELQINAYNLGQGGKGPYEYIQILKTFGLQKKPNIVIMAVFEGNDLPDTQQYWDYREGRGISEKRSAEDCSIESRLCTYYLTIINSALGKYSYAFNLALVSVRLGRAEFIEQKEDEGRDLTYIIKGTDGNIPFNRDNVGATALEFASELIVGTKTPHILDEALENFKTLSESHGFTPIVVYIPTAHTTYITYADFVDVDAKEIYEQYSVMQRSYYQEKLQKLDILFIDTTRSLQDASKNFRNEDALLYFPTNLHLTIHGHRVVADFILQELAASNVF